MVDVMDSVSICAPEEWTNSGATVFCLFAEILKVDSNFDCSARSVSFAIAGLKNEA
jgi:hypothetical protein